MLKWFKGLFYFVPSPRALALLELIKQDDGWRKSFSSGIFSHENGILLYFNVPGDNFPSMSGLWHISVDNLNVSSFYTFRERCLLRKEIRKQEVDNWERVIKKSLGS